LFSLIGVVYIIGLFVPLIDNDSAHHATIALHMHLTGDYASLVDQSGDYLDKPHLLFWLAAFSYKIFGVTSFAYKFPSLLFTIGGIYSTYRLGKQLYNEETGKLSSLLLASAFAFIISVSDVRMEAILTACIAFSTWQLAAFIDSKKTGHALLAGLGLALGFATKGQIGVFVPAVFALFYILFKKDYTIFLNWRWILMGATFFLFISPVIYAYYLQYNLHPEKTVRGKDHINGIKFILFNQSVERFSGGMGGDSKNDYLFFIHSFLWAFAPWSLFVFTAVFLRLKGFLKRTEEWGTTFCFLAVLLIVSFSGFKLPHYLNIVFPVASVMAARLVLVKSNDGQWVKWFFIIQVVTSVLLLVIAAILNAWAFPVKNVFLLSAVVLLLSMFFYFYKQPLYTKAQKLILLPVTAVILFFLLMNGNFYPGLLQYQAGKQLAIGTRGKVDPAEVYIEKNAVSYSASYNFYSRSLNQVFDDSLLSQGKKAWLLTEPASFERLKSEGYHFGKIYVVPHFRITKLNLKFLNPATRDSQTSKMMLAEIISKN
jgi:4-amino-4-deoxy-L-arabinose transferase-like glycosyltransferase